MSDDCSDATFRFYAEDKDLDAYKPADLAMALCRMVSYNIAQLAYLNAKREGINRIFFGGGHDTGQHTGDWVFIDAHSQQQALECAHCSSLQPRKTQASSYEDIPTRWRLSASPLSFGPRWTESHFVHTCFAYSVCATGSAGWATNHSMQWCLQGTMKALFLRHEGELGQGIQFLQIKIILHCIG
jgi:Fumble